MSTLVFHRCWRLAALFLAATGLSGCLTTFTPPSKISHVTPEEVLIVFDAPEFAGTAPKRAKFMDNMDLEEYARFEGGGAVAEVIYSATVPEAYFTAALDYPFTVDESVRTWNFALRHTLEWGPVDRAAADLTEFFYRPFRIVDTNRSCVGFSADWDMVVHDPDVRSRKSMFGYYCARPGEALSADRMVDLLDSIAVRGLNRRMRKKGQVAKMSSQAEPWQVARGQGSGSETGNAGFPYRFAEPIDQDGESAVP